MCSSVKKHLLSCLWHSWRVVLGKKGFDLLEGSYREIFENPLLMLMGVYSLIINRIAGRMPGQMDPKFAECLSIIGSSMAIKRLNNIDILALRRWSFERPPTSSLNCLRDVRGVDPPIYTSMVTGVDRRKAPYSKKGPRFGDLVVSDVWVSSSASITRPLLIKRRSTW